MKRPSKTYRMEKTPLRNAVRKYSRFWMAFVYVLAAAFPVYQVIRHTDLEIDYLRAAYDTDNLQNNGSVKEAAFWKEASSKHHFLGPLIKHFLAPSLDRQFHIPPLEEAKKSLGQIPGWMDQEKDEKATALLWLLLLSGVSLLYFALAFLPRGKTQSGPVFALALISVVFLVVGITAAAMVIVVSPATPVFPHFILHYEVRSILGVIFELYSSRYWFIGVCLTIFSVLIPFAKAGLTVFVLESSRLSRKIKIAKFLHSISKWSMADVFVVAILLSNFAIRANRSTQGHLFLGFYCFLGYCLLSLVTTTWLQHQVEGVQAKVHSTRPFPRKARKR